MAKRGHASVSRTVMVEGGKIYVRMTYDGVWMISFEPDKEQYPDAEARVVEHTPPRGEDNLSHVISWARGEWARRLSAANGD